MIKFLLLSLLAVSATGCRSLLVERTPIEVVPARTNFVQILTTNVVTQEVWKTNSVVVTPQRTENGVVLPAVMSLQPVRELQSVAQVQTNLQTIVLPAIYYTNLALGSAAKTAITTAGDLAPIPWGGALGEGLVALSGLVFGAVNMFAKRKALKAAGEAQSTADLYKDASVVLVKNVEQVRQAALKVPGYTPAIDRNVVRGMQAIQTAAKVGGVIADMVNEHTGETLEEANAHNNKA